MINFLLWTVYPPRAQWYFLAERVQQVSLHYRHRHDVGHDLIIIYVYILRPHDEYVDANVGAALRPSRLRDEGAEVREQHQPLPAEYVHPRALCELGFGQMTRARLVWHGC